MIYVFYLYRIIFIHKIKLMIILNGSIVTLSPTNVFYKSIRMTHMYNHTFFPKY